MRVDGACAVLVLTVLMTATTIQAAATKDYNLPKNFPKCKRNDVVCLKDAVHKAIGLMVKGIPKLGVPPVDPLHVTEMVINQSEGPVSLKLTFRNQDLHGIGASTVQSVKSDMTDDSYSLTIGATIPTFALRGEYVADGRVLVLPLQGNGKDNLTLTDVKAQIKLIGHVEARDTGHRHVVLDDLQFRFDTNRLYIYLENLFNGDRTLGDNMLVFLNDNWREVLDGLKPGIEEAVGAVFLEISKRIYDRVSYTNMHDVP